MPHRETKGKENAPLVDPTTINPQNQLPNRAKAENEDPNWENYKHKIVSYKKAIRRAKRTAWQTFRFDIEKTTDAARLRKILCKTAAPLGCLQKANGSWSDSSKESCS